MRGATRIAGAAGMLAGIALLALSGARGPVAWAGVVLTVVGFVVFSTRAQR